MVSTLCAQVDLQEFSFEEVEEQVKRDPKPIVVFIHTDWCKYCLRMKRLTFRDKEVIQKLTADYYFISFDAEQKSNISFLGQNYDYKPSGTNTGVHELAEKLGTVNGVLNFPTLVILSPKFDVLFQKGEVLSKAQIRSVLDYFGNE